MQQKKDKSCASTGVTDTVTLFASQLRNTAHKEAASLLNATSVPCPLCSLCASSSPCPYKEVTAQRGWSGRSLPTGRATTVRRGSEAPTTSAHAVDSATGLKSKNLEAVTHQTGFQKAVCTHTIYESQYCNVTLVTTK